MKTKKWMSAAFLAFVALCGVAAVYAAPGDTTIGYTAPTTRTDGTPIALSEITGFQWYQNCDTTPVAVGTAGKANPVTLPTGLPVGTYKFCGRTLASDGTQSIMGPTITAQYAVLSPPNPPQPTSVIFECPAGMIGTPSDGGTMIVYTCR